MHIHIHIIIHIHIGGPARPLLMLDMFVVGIDLFIMIVLSRLTIALVKNKGLRRVAVAGLRSLCMSGRLLCRTSCVACWFTWCSSWCSYTAVSMAYAATQTCACIHEPVSKP